MGYVLPAATSDEKACLYYYDIVDRTPAAIPRKTLRADTFACPPEHAPGLLALEQKIQTGNDIRPHLSLGVLNPDNFDGLLLDWGIHHLHLGTTAHPQDSNFMARTGPLLYARFSDDTAYLLGIMEHGKWSDQDLIRILHRNWPSAMEQYRVKGAVGLSYSPSDSDIGNLRKSQINALLEVEPGVIYCHLGSGINAAGSSVASAMKLNKLRRFFTESEKMIHMEFENWRHKGTDPAGEFDFKLEISDGALYAFAPAQSVAIKIRNGA